MNRLCIFILAAVVGQIASHAAADDPRAISVAQFERTVIPFLARHCHACHGEKAAKKELNFRELDPDMKTSTSAARWAVVRDQLKSGKMPPEDEPRPSADAIDAVVRWIEAELKRAGKHVARREEYDNGNALDHSLLFGHKAVAKLDIPTGVRRMSPEQYDAFTKEVGKGLNGLGNPFAATGRTTFKDMGAPKLDEPTTAAVLRNALSIVEQRLTAFKVEDGVIKAVGQGAAKQYLRLLDDAHPPSTAELKEAFKLIFEMVLKRLPTDEEVARFTALYERNVQDAGRVTGARYTLAAVFLLPEAIFRLEQGIANTDREGLVRLKPREIAFAIAFALTDRRPESWLLAAADKGELDTREGVSAAVQRMLDDPKLDKPRILRFFREYFQYAQAEDVFKDTKLHSEHDARALVEDTDRLVQSILDEDKNVFAELLTTNKAFVAYKSAAETKKKRAEELAKFEREKEKDPKKYETKKPPKIGRSIYEAYNLSDFPDEQPVELPREERAGILTQPSWLVAFSKSDENHAILRGKWIRERLLGNVVPDIPITVDAQLPNAPEKTLRERMAVTHEEYCWQCHRLMNRLGYPLESFDHLGRHRTEEAVLDLEANAANLDKKGKLLGDVLRTVPADARGSVEFVGDDRVEGDVRDAVELLHRLAESERVEQVFIRHAFRYWLGRNETPGDATSLQAAHQAYKQSGGSMKALITAILTSDSFLNRAADSSTAAGSAH